MMSWFRTSIASLVMFLGSVSIAQSVTDQAQDLTDYMTPAELMYEVGINPMDSMMLWNASTQNPRLVLVIDRAEKGTSPTAQTLEVYLDGEQIHKFKASTGKEERVTTPSGQTYFATTPVGEFRIYSRRIDHKSKKWGGAAMPFAQFFNGGIAVHGTVPMHYDKLGSRDSGGCIRLHLTNAKIVWNLVGEIGVKETKVIVFDGSEQNHPVADSWVREPVPTPTPRPQPRPQPPVDRYDPYQPQPYPYPQPVQPQYPPQQHYPPPQGWVPSANPTPPPQPPRGLRDSYPYCRPGFWCPYR